MSKTKLPTIEVKTRLVEEKYVTLPWQKLANGWDVANSRAKKIGEVLDAGEVDIKISLLHELAEQGEWDSQFGSAFISLDMKQGWAVEQAGLGVRETRGGHHGTELLDKWLESEELL